MDARAKRLFNENVVLLVTDRVQLALEAIRAEAVGELHVGMLLHEELHLAPIAAVVANFLAAPADGQATRNRSRNRQAPT